MEHLLHKFLNEIKMSIFEIEGHLTEDYLVDLELRNDHYKEELEELRKEGKYLFKIITSTEDGHEFVSDPFIAETAGEAKDLAESDLAYPNTHVVAVVRHDDPHYNNI